jgi:hypothetical protein
MFGEDIVDTEKERQEYERDLKRVATLNRSLSQGKARDLKAYEKFADDIDRKWRQKNRADHARLMLNICRPLSSGTFKESRRYDVARTYALAALEMPDKIPLATELELVGHVTTLRIGPGAVKGEKFAGRRTEDATVRLHAWKRLMNAVDPKWDPDKVTWTGNIAPPASTGLPAGVDPAAIKDPKLRKEYEAAIERNRQKAEAYNEQYAARKWLKRFPKRAEREIVQAYSHPPFATEELKKLLYEHLPDKEAAARILKAVEQNTHEK